MVAQRPSHIPLPPPFFVPDDLDPPFYSAPSTPDLASPQIFYTPPSSPLPSPPVPPPPDDPHPSVDVAFDLVLTDDALSTLEKIYLFSSSKAVFHRVFIAQALPSFLDEVSPQEANEYVLPLLTGLALDDDEQVKEALATQLVPIIWWFFTNCQVIPGEPGMDAEVHQEVVVATISVQAFTPILGTLLLSPNPQVGAVARYAVVDLLERIRKADDAKGENLTLTRPNGDVDFNLITGLFGPQERAMFQDEILQQVVIGMGHLDIDAEYPISPGPVPSELSKNDIVAGRPGHSESFEYQPTKDTVNPYFPTTFSDRSFGSLVPNNSHTSTPLDLSLPNNRLIDPLSSKHLSDRQTSPPTSTTHLTRTRFMNDVSSSNSHSVIPADQLNPPQSGRLSPELVDSVPPGGIKNEIGFDSAHDRVGFSWKCTCDDTNEHDDYDDQKAAVGRLSSMSLMAAVTASGSLDEETKQAFVGEVERVAGDPVSWVRTEASFALGALAKVVPVEVIRCSLLPLFEQLRCDTAWRVRHSAVFTLPAILSRLQPHERRKLALETIICLATDESATVRLGVLEVLGEVLYTFYADDEGVPADLLNLFLGKKGRQDLLIGPGPNRNHFLDLFLQDPKRPLICAFNYPAVVLALGKERWNDVRDLYLSLAADGEFKVRRTLAASLGELAKIIGEDHAQRDLVQLWWNVIRSEDDEVRLKAAENVGTFSAALGPRNGASVVEGILTVWDEGILKTWRERDCVAKSLVELSQWGQQVIPLAIINLLGRALEDNVASVRESAVAALPFIWKFFSNQPDFLLRLQTHLLTLANAATYRKRMTFVACQQSLISSDEDFSHIFVSDSLDAIEKLASDSVDGVRIGIARLVGIMCEKLTRNAIPITGTMLTLIRRLSHDNSHDVRAYIPDLSKISQNHERTIPSETQTRTFSRPPMYGVSYPGRTGILDQRHNRRQ